MVEQLEDRVLLATVGLVVGTSVAFTGDGAADTAILTVDGGGYLAINGSTDLNNDSSANDLLVANVTSFTYNDTGNNDTLGFEGSSPFIFNSALAISIGTTNEIMTLNVAQDLILSGPGTFIAEAARNVALTSGSSITTADGNLTLKANQSMTPTSGNFTGIELHNAEIASTNGDILLQGRGGNDASSNSHRGIFIHSNSRLESHGTNKIEAGKITIDGTGGVGTNRDIGVWIDGSIVRSVSGDISVTGQGNWNGIFAYGVYLDNSGVVESIGTSKADAAAITIDGIAGNGTSNGIGVIVARLGSRVSSIAGDIKVTGQGGDGTAGENCGVFLTIGGAVESTGINKADAAMITIDGTGGNGTTNNYGVCVTDSGSRVSSEAGDISIFGQGTGKGSDNHGVYLVNGVVESKGINKANAATITIDGTGGSGTASNVGVRVEGADSKVGSVAGDIWITGRGGIGTTFNVGVFLYANGSVESTGSNKADAATITIDGIGGDGTDVNYGVFVWQPGSSVISAAGDISIVGQAGNGTGNFNIGVGLQDGGVVESTGMSKADAAIITIEGTGGNGSLYNVGTFFVGASIISSAGNINILGQGGNGSGEGNVGTLISTGTHVESTGSIKANAASISISGTGGGITATDSNIGIEVRDSGADTRITSNAGDIWLAGYGGNATGKSNHGVLVYDGAVVESTGITKPNAGMITIRGAGSGGTVSNFGADITNASVISSAGDINIFGQGGSGSDFNFGVHVAAFGGDSRVVSKSGHILLKGAGGDASGESNHGILVNGAVIESTGTSKLDAGTITIDGKGGDGTVFNIGVFILSASVISSAGDISILGQGGNGSGEGNVGTLFLAGAQVKSIGTTKADAARITVSGTGGGTTATDFNNGVEVRGFGAGTRVTSKAGDILLNGQGGDATGMTNIGVAVWDGGLVQSTGTTPDAASITVNGTGGDGSYNNLGAAVYLSGSMTTEAGNMSISGQGGNGSGDSNTGVQVSSNGSIVSNGISNIVVLGMAGTGVSQGVFVTSSNVATDGGNIDVTGTGSGGAASIQATGIDAGSGNVILTAPTGVVHEAEAGTDVSGSSITFNGDVAPAGMTASGQIIIDGDVTFDDVFAYTVELNGLTAVTEYDQLQVIGVGRAVALSAATLNVSLGFESLAGDEFVIVDNVDSTSVVSGTFAGLPDGASLTSGGTVFHIFYNAGTDNNDVALVVNRAPTTPVDNNTASNQIDENAATGTLVGVTVISTDPDGDEATYTLADDAGGRFQIDGNGVVTVADGTLLDYETDTSYNIKVRSSDGLGGESAEATFTINIRNITAVISGTVFLDTDGDGLFDGGTETGIDYVTVDLLVSDGGKLATEITMSGGVYAFPVNDELGTFRIREIQPTGVGDGAAILGDAGGIILSSNEIQLTLTGDDASGYDFTEVGQAVQAADTATIGFWQNKNGQTLIQQGGATLVSWLDANFGNIFGDAFSDGVGGDDAFEVASFYKHEFFKKKVKGSSKVDAQFMSLAFAAFFTSSDLSGSSVAGSYGFNVTETGIGTKLVNVGNTGAAFDVDDGTDLTIMAMLQATNSVTGLKASGYSNVYDSNGDGVIDAAEAALRAMANQVYSSINEAGDI